MVQTLICYAPDLLRSKQLIDGVVNCPYTTATTQKYYVEIGKIIMKNPGILNVTARAKDYESYSLTFQYGTKILVFDLQKQYNHIF